MLPARITRPLVVIVCLVGSSLSSSLDGFPSSGFFGGDLVILNKNDVERNYERKLIVVLSVLPAKRHCEFLRTTALHFSTNLETVSNVINRYSMEVSGRTFTVRRKCRLKPGLLQLTDNSRNTTIQTNSSIEKSFIINQLVRLYNKLPLPFQCQILEEVGWKSVVNSKNKFNGKSDSWSDDRVSEVGRIVQKTEQVLGNAHALIRVGGQCARIVSGEDSYIATVKFSCLTTVSDSKAWLRLFRKQMARVYGKFASENGMQIPKEVLLFVGSKDFPYNAYHIEILNLTTEGKYHEVMFHIHLKKANSKALPANFILSSLHRYSKDNLEKIFRSSNITFTVVLDKRGRRPSRRYNNMRKLFPAYLSKYFSMLDAHEKCFILSMLSSYTNHTLSRIIQFLNRKRFQVQISCFPKRNDVSAKSNRENIVVSPQITISPRTESKLYIKSTKALQVIQRKFGKKKYEQKTIIAVTPVEISMFVVLGAVAIVGTIFVLICITYIKRKRAMKNSPTRPENEGTLCDLTDADSVAELDWIRRTRQIESEVNILRDVNNFTRVPIAQGNVCVRCALQENHQVPHYCVYSRGQDWMFGNNQVYRDASGRPLLFRCPSSDPSSVDTAETAKSSTLLRQSPIHLWLEKSATESEPHVVRKCKFISGNTCTQNHCTHSPYKNRDEDCDERLSNIERIHFVGNGDVAYCITQQEGSFLPSTEVQGSNGCHDDNEYERRTSRDAPIGRSDEDFIPVQTMHVNSLNPCQRILNTGQKQSPHCIEDSYCTCSDDSNSNCTDRINRRDPREDGSHYYKEILPQSTILKHLPSRNGRINRASQAEPYNSRVIRGARRTRANVPQEQINGESWTTSIVDGRLIRYPANHHVDCGGTTV